MMRSALRMFALLVVMAALFTACKTVPPLTDDLVGTWSQKEGKIELVWEFRADGSIHIQTPAGGGKREGIFRHLEGNRVAVDFGDDFFSIVQITVTGGDMMMINPNGDQTVLKRRQEISARR